jgi:hypothetical protein
MSITITSSNFNGQLADITFYPCSGGSVSLGYQLLPYVYNEDNYQGNYDIYISGYNKTCQLVIACPTPTQTPTQTATPTPTPTPYPVCPSELILSATTPNLLYGLYTRATIYTGGTFEAVWYNSENLTLNYGTNPDGNEYIAYQISSGSDYTSLFWASDSLGNSGKWTIMYSSGNTIFNGGAQTADIAILDSNAITDGVWYYPPSGNLQFNGGYVQYPSTCPTPTPTPSITPSPTPQVTSTPTSTGTPQPTTTPTTTPTPTEPAGHKLQAENSDFIQTEGGDNINIEN